VKVVLATRNAKKLVELRRVLVESELGIDVLGLDEVTTYPEPAETERSFEGNALIKARVCAAATGLPALADDSGLEVELLNGMPGVRSARWAGPSATDAENLHLLIAQLADASEADRAARFVCAMALVLPSGAEHVVRGEMLGRLVPTPRGEHGFGYDPIFIAAGQSLTNAELPPSAKDAISHRGKAVRLMVARLAEEI
jgi:XTP/dITP diphosphohydrolase